LGSDDLAGSEEEFNLDADDDVAAYLLDSEDGGDIDNQHEDAASEEDVAPRGGKVKARGCNLLQRVAGQRGGTCGGRRQQPGHC
jgi:hypothetical protein